MPAGVSELSTTVAPAPRASTDGRIQYSETATTSTAHRPTTASACRHGPAPDHEHHDRYGDELEQRHHARVHPGRRREGQREAGRPPPAGPAPTPRPGRAARARGRAVARAAAPTAAGSPASCRPPPRTGWRRTPCRPPAGQRPQRLRTRPQRPVEPGRPQRADREQHQPQHPDRQLRRDADRLDHPDRRRHRRQPDVERREAELRVRLPGRQVRGGAAPRREVELRLGVDREGAERAEQHHLGQHQPERHGRGPGGRPPRARPRVLHASRPYR